MATGPSPQTVDLGKLDIGSAREQAITYSIYADIASRVFMVLVIGGIFYWLNDQVMSFVRAAFDQDVELLTAKTIGAEHRVITNNVVMSLVGATVVQVGAAIVVIVSYLFPKRNATAG